MAKTNAELQALDQPKSRNEEYLNFLCGRAVDINSLPDKPYSRVEEYLEYLCHNRGQGGGGQPQPFNGVERVAYDTQNKRLTVTYTNGAIDNLDLANLSDTTEVQYNNNTHIMTVTRNGVPTEIDLSGFNTKVNNIAPINGNVTIKSEHIEYDDVSNIGADTVQKAIEKLKKDMDLIDGAEIHIVADKNELDGLLGQGTLNKGDIIYVIDSTDVVDYDNVNVDNGNNPVSMIYDDAVGGNHLRLFSKVVPTIHLDASNVAYDRQNSTLTSNNVQDAIDELNGKFIENVTYDETQNRTIFKTKGGQQDIVVEGLVTRWADLDHVEEYTHINILDYSKVIPNKAIDGYGEHIDASAYWGTVEFPVTANEDYTLLRQSNSNVKIRFVDNNGAKVGFVNSPAPSSNSWHRCKFTAPLGAIKGILEVNITQHNEYKTMIFLGDQLGLSVDTNKPIPFADNKYIQIGKEVSLGFDNSDCDIKSTTISDAIKELSLKSEEVDWRDLSYVEQYKYINLMDYNKRIYGQWYDDNSGVMKPNGAWSVYELDVISGNQYTILRKRDDSTRYVYFNGVTHVSTEMVVNTSINEWNRQTITIPQGANKVHFCFQHNMNQPQEIMVLEGEIIEPVDFIPYVSEPVNVLVGLEVGYKFNNANTNLQSTTVANAIRELEGKSSQYVSKVKPNLISEKTVIVDGYIQGNKVSSVDNNPVTVNHMGIGRFFIYDGLGVRTDTKISHIVIGVNENLNVGDMVSDVKIGYAKMVNFPYVRIEKYVIENGISFVHENKDPNLTNCTKAITVEVNDTVTDDIMLIVGCKDAIWGVKDTSTNGLAAGGASVPLVGETRTLGHGNWVGKVVVYADEISLKDMSNNITTNSNEIQDIKNNKVDKTQIGNTAGKIPEIENTGKLSTSIMPSIAITDVHVVQDSQAMMQLTVQVGDVVVVQNEGNKTYMCKDPSQTDKDRRFIEINMGFPVVKNINGHTPDPTGAITINGTQINVDGQSPGTTIKDEFEKCVRMVNNQPPQINGNVNVTATTIHAVVGVQSPKSVQAILNDLHNTANNHTPRIANLENRRPAHIGEIINTFEDKGAEFTENGATFVYIGAQKRVTPADYPELARIFNKQSVASYLLPVVANTLINFDGGSQTSIKHYICAKFV